jgi:hypothetical protein
VNSWNRHILLGIVAIALTLVACSSPARSKSVWPLGDRGSLLGLIMLTGDADSSSRRLPTAIVKLGLGVTTDTKQAPLLPPHVEVGIGASWKFVDAFYRYEHSSYDDPFNDHPDIRFTSSTTISSIAIDCTSPIGLYTTIGYGWGTLRSDSAVVLQSHDTVAVLAPSKASFKSWMAGAGYKYGYFWAELRENFSLSNLSLYGLPGVRNSELVIAAGVRLLIPPPQ